MCARVSARLLPRTSVGAVSGSLKTFLWFRPRCAPPTRHGRVFVICTHVFICIYNYLRVYTISVMAYQRERGNLSRLVGNRARISSFRIFQQFLSDVYSNLQVGRYSKNEYISNNFLDTNFITCFIIHVTFIRLD